MVTKKTIKPTAKKAAAKPASKKVAKKAAIAPKVVVKETKQTELTHKQKCFVDEYLIDLNGTQAAIRAGYSKKTANEQAARLLVNVNVQKLLSERMKDREARTEVTQDRVLAEWWGMLTADMNDLVEYRRGCCRHCYGDEFKFQRTQAEYLKASGSETGIDINEDGGTGFDPRKSPNQDCPECFGDGYGRLIIKDTRTLPPAVRALYAGVKQTKEGIQVMTHSKDKALEMVARHLGMLKDKVELTGKDGGPIALAMEQIAANPNSRLKIK